MTVQDGWDTVLLRLTAFVDEPDYSAGSDWWVNVVGSDPEEKNERSKPIVHEYKGQFEDNDLRLVIQPIRIDWVYSGVDTPEKSPTLGPFDSQMVEFEKLLDKWFKQDNCPSMNRLALGAILHRSVDNRLAGYELLMSEYIPFGFRFDEKSSDFLYQINRRQQSQVFEGMEINRLMKWSVAQRQVLLFHPVQKELPPVYFAQLELDINSLKDFEGSISPEQAMSLWGEFVEMGREIIRKGDDV